MNHNDLILHVMNCEHELNKEEAMHYARKFLGSLPQGMSVGNIYTLAENTENFGKAIGWALAHNQMDGSKETVFVAGDDVKREMY